MNTVNIGRRANKSDIYVNNTKDVGPHTSAQPSIENVQLAGREGRISPVKCGMVFLLKAELDVGS